MCIIHIIQQLLCQMICGLIDTQSGTAFIDEEVSHQMQVAIYHHNGGERNHINRKLVFQISNKTMLHICS